MLIPVWCWTGSRCRTHVVTTTPARPKASRLRLAEVPEVITALEQDFGRLPQGLWDPRHHYLLDALDRQESQRFIVWGDDRPRSVVHIGLTGTVVPAGDPRGAAELAPFVDRSRWRIMIGDEAITAALLDLGGGRSWWRRRPSVRVQRFMTVDHTTIPSIGPVDGFRRGSYTDLGWLEEFACQLHVEDQMGPPLQGTARVSVRQRMAESVDRGMTWVVERSGQPVAKVDLSLHSVSRGAQVAGVFVHPSWRGRGIAGTMVNALSRELLSSGMPVVSLHVRDDNEPAIHAYRNAGYVQRGNWLLALR